MRDRPDKDEYAGHFSDYIELVPDGDILHLLERQQREMVSLLDELTEEQGYYRYAPDKWCLKEVIGHVTDNERIMSYRLLRIARGDTTPLPGYNQDVLVPGGNFDLFQLPQLVEDYIAVRKATLTLLRGLTDEAWLRTGTASEHSISARALAYVIAGHELHHMRIIRERYLND
ncbi:DinB family protein [Cohnella lubricantis]|uniref:DinB family protein n=1 Tax=Cohnella lubricantis TaxID=2163172 RepID=A0A841TEN6_9BACL|nr:DinB family protein [Cohnella lubricantis]MBB6679492.1 DinB family protein [Cohnella lubricantis]MBP2118758.1 hypothetical protein [Cohnella lubricantis]